MTQKEKLMSLFACTILEYEDALEISDYLLANGVVVLPCKVGDTIYFIGKSLESGEYIVCDDKAEAIEIDSDGWTVFDEHGCYFSQSAANVPYFTREAAEAALKKMEGMEGEE